MKKYTAPWSTSLVIMSSVSTLICLGIAIGVAWSGRPWMALLPLAIVVGGILFTIRGYTVTPDALIVHRMFWTTRLPLAGLHSAQVEPEAMRWSIRTFGNGGLFAFTGWFRNTTLGAYRAFVTDPRRTVVLSFTGRTVVVSPSTPEEFVRDVRMATHAA